MWPAPRRPGNSCTWSVRRAPAESTSQTIGTCSARAASVARTIFSTVRAPHDPALTIGSLATTTAGIASIVPRPGDDAVGRQPGGHGVGEDAVLDERAVVEQQVDALPRRQLALAADLLERPLVGDEGSLDGVADLVRHAVHPTRSGRARGFPDAAPERAGRRLVTAEGGDIGDGATSVEQADTGTGRAHGRCVRLYHVQRPVTRRRRRGGAPGRARSSGRTTAR